MKVLFTGTYRQNDGWGRSSQDYLRALKLVPNIELEAKPIILSNRLDPDGKTAWNDVEAANIGKPDVCIYHTPPQFCDVSPDCYNIALFHLETDNISKSSYMNNVNNFNEFWVSTDLELDTLIYAGIPESKCSVVPMPINLNKLDAPMDIEMDQFKDNFLFLYVGDLTMRKNVQAAVLAYWREFIPEDNARFVLKLTMPPHPKKTGDEMAMEWLDRLQSIYRLYDDIDDYPEIHVITDHLTDEKLIGLQNRANCFVMPSRGESTCRPLLESCYLGKQIICTNGIGCINYNMMGRQVYCVPSYTVPCDAPNAPIEGVYRSWETWKNIDIMELQEGMRRVFAAASSYKVEPTRKEKIRNVHSYDSVARLIEDKLRRVRI